MKRVFALAMALLFGAPASAQMVDEYCNDYWFVRNQAFNQAGYCFGSALGQALFDNSDCIGKNVALSPRNQALVDGIRRLEAEGGCNVDTTRSTLPIPLIYLRLQLTDLAARDPHSGAGCFGWTGPGFMLWPGYREQGVPLSEVRPGDDLIFLYETTGVPDGWVYLEVKRDGAPVGLGWAHGMINWDQCTRVAG